METMSADCWSCRRHALYRLRCQHLQLVYLFAFVEFAVVSYEVSLLLRRSERTPMGQYPRQAIGADKAPAWAGVQLRPFFVSHFPSILCRPTDIAGCAVERPFIEQKCNFHTIESLPGHANFAD